MIQKRMEDLYKILQVDPKADPDVIRAAFRVLAQKNHPDLNHTSIASEAMMRLNGAYETLRDPRLRSLYDGQRVTGVGQSTGVHHDPDFADWAASQAQAAHPAGKRNPNEPSRIFEVRTLSQSRAGKTGLWVGMADGLLVLLALLSGVNQGARDLPYQVVTKVWVALMVSLILWGLIWSFGDLFDLVYPRRAEAEATDSQEHL